jgi:hypothetical protein
MDPVEPSRRRYPRLPSENLVLVNRVGDAEAEQLAHTRNVSLGGCRIIVRERLGVGAVVQVLARIGDQVVDCFGRAVYEVKHRGGEFEVGIEFLYLSDADRRRLRTFLDGSPGAPTTG